MDDFAAAADEWHIENGYWDVFGRRHDTSPETLRQLVKALSAGGRKPAAIADAQGEPLRAWQGEGRRRLWALCIQLYGIRSLHNWGHGDFSDLSRVIELAASCGAGAIGLNPLHALFPGAASPYAPTSRRFLNPLYIDVDAIPEFSGAAAAALDDQIARLRDAPLIDYPRVAKVKLAGLRAAHAAFRQGTATARRADFAAYRADEGDALLAFACFEVLRAQFSEKPWKKWPQQWRKPGRAQLQDFRRANEQECEFHEFMQWEANRQLAACSEVARRHGMPVGLYIDLAVGIDPNGADAWSQQDFLLTDVTIGAPPDEYNRAGQNWGLAPFNPHALADHDFAPLRELLRAAMRHAGAVRIDHVLGLNRLFMILHGMKPADGTYVRYPFKSLLRVVAEESNRHRCIVIGEDLGTVPDTFRAALVHWGLWCYRVMMFERDGDGNFLPPESYPGEALATFNTHDLASFAGWRSGHDLDAKIALGLDPGETEDVRAKAAAALRDRLARSAPGFSPSDFAAVAAFLAATPSRLAAVALEDIVGEVEQINIPGTVDEHPNWRRRLSVNIEDLASDARLANVARAFAEAGRSAKA
jgi:4-alpha-glucanotransferase